MPEYRRLHLKGGIHFITKVTYNRQRLLFNNIARQILHDAWDDVAKRFSFSTIAVWQRRYWEHTIRDREDLDRHMDYIHFNPVKHGLVQNVRDWEWSSFHQYVRMGWIDADWGSDVDVRGLKGDFGD